MSDNVTKFPTKEDTVTVSLDTYLENMKELITSKKVKSILTIMYSTEDDGDDPTLYLAGEFIRPREILGDLRFIEDFILNDF